MEEMLIMSRASYLFLCRYYIMTSTICNRKFLQKIEPMKRKIVIIGINGKGEMYHGKTLDLSAAADASDRLRSG